MTPYQRQVIKALSKMVDFTPLQLHFQLKDGSKITTEDAEDIAMLIFSNMDQQFINEKMVEIKSYELVVPGFDSYAWKEVYIANIEHNEKQ